MPNLAQKPFAESQPAPDPVIQLGEALGLRVELSPEIPKRPHLHRLQQPHFNRAYSIGREATAEEGEKPNAGGSLPALRGDVFARFIKGILHATPKEDGEAHAAFSNRTDTAPGSDGLTLVIEHDDRADQKLCEVRDAFLAPESADRLTQLKKLHQMASLAEIAFLAKAETKVLAATRATPSIYFDAGGKPVLGLEIETNHQPFIIACCTARRESANRTGAPPFVVMSLPHHTFSVVVNDRPVSFTSGAMIHAEGRALETLYQLMLRVAHPGPDRGGAGALGA